MRDVLSRALVSEGESVVIDATTDRILAAAFFRKRPLQAGSSAHVVLLADRRREMATFATATTRKF